MILQRLRQHARTLKLELTAIALAYRDPRVSWPARLLAAGIIAYAVSPIDLIPDWIPVLGILDDLIILPLAISLALRLIPADVMEDCRAQARDHLENGRRGAIAAAVIIVIWVLLFAGVGYWLYHRLSPKT